MTEQLKTLKDTKALWAEGLGHNDLVTVTTESNRTLLLKYWAGVQTGAVIEKCGQDWRVKSEEDLK